MLTVIWFYNVRFEEDTLYIHNIDRPNEPIGEYDVCCTKYNSKTGLKARHSFIDCQLVYLFINRSIHLSWKPWFLKKKKSWFEYSITTFDRNKMILHRWELIVTALQRGIQQESRPALSMGPSCHKVYSICGQPLLCLG